MIYHTSSCCFNISLKSSKLMGWLPISCTTIFKLVGNSATFTSGCEKDTVLPINPNFRIIKLKHGSFELISNNNKDK